MGGMSVNEITVRFARKEDAPDLLAIYAPYVLETPVSFEYDVPSVEEFARRIETISAQFPYLVCEIDGTIAGYVYAGPYHERAAYGWDCELTAYVSKGYHRRGIASSLYSTLIRMVRAQGYYNAYALIAIPNPESVAFHKAMGFVQELSLIHI